MSQPFNHKILKKVEKPRSGDNFILFIEDPSALPADSANTCLPSEKAYIFIEDKTKIFKRSLL